MDSASRFERSQLFHQSNKFQDELPTKTTTQHKEKRSFHLNAKFWITICVLSLLLGGTIIIIITTRSEDGTIDHFQDVLPELSTGFSPIDASPTSTSPPSTSPESPIVKSSEPTSLPADSSIYDPPSAEECKAVSNGEIMMAHQDKQLLHSFKVSIDLVLAINVDQEAVIEEFEGKMQTILMPIIIGCNEATIRRKMLSFETKIKHRRHLIFTPYSIAGAQVDAEMDYTECATSEFSNCIAISVNIDFYLKGPENANDLRDMLSLTFGPEEGIVEILEMSNSLAGLAVRSVESKAETSPETSSLPTVLPSTKPTMSPTIVVSSDPTIHSIEPTTSEPTMLPSPRPSALPTKAVSSIPSVSPSRDPTSGPTTSPSRSPSRFPTTSPSRGPSRVPTSLPSTNPTNVPSSRPTSNPSCLPSIVPTITASTNPTFAPVPWPTTKAPTKLPSSAPSKVPTTSPSNKPSLRPSSPPTPYPTFSPSLVPTHRPSSAPSSGPTFQPSVAPSRAPTSTPTTTPPTREPSKAPTREPSTSPTHWPTTAPSVAPTQRPSTSSSPTLTPPLRVACVGDSLTRGTSGGNRWYHSYPSQLQGMLGVYFEVHNYGRNAMTALRGLSVSYVDKWQFQASLDVKPDIYLLMLGTNDARLWVEHGYKFRGDFQWIVNRVRNNSAETPPRIIVAIPPWVKTDIYGITNDVLVRYVQPQIQSAAALENVQLVNMYDVTVNQPHMFAYDGLHLNQDGYLALAEAWKSAVECNPNGICEVGEDSVTCPADCN